MARGREAFHHVPNAEADPPVHLHIVFKIPQLKNGRQLAPNQQIGRLEKAAVLGQLLKGIAPVGEQTPVAVDRTDGRLGRWHPLQARPKRGRDSCGRSGLGVAIVWSVAAGLGRHGCDLN